MVQDADLRVALTAPEKAGAAISFARSGVLRLGEFFSPDVAEALHHHLDTEVPWARAVSQEDRSWDLAPELVAAMDEGKDTELISSVHQTARDGFQFLFDSLIVSDDASQRKARGLLVDRLVEALNHPASLDAFREITGEPAVCRVNGQASRYLPGHFLTSHDDGIEGQDRVAAYVINLTKDWREDWGGMLQFHSASGDIPLALKPAFNALNMFRVPQMHSVSYVAPFAALPRYSVTGWLCR